MAKEWDYTCAIWDRDLLVGSGGAILQLRIWENDGLCVPAGAHMQMFRWRCVTPWCQRQLVCGMRFWDGSGCNGQCREQWRSHSPCGNLEEEKLKSLGCCKFNIHVDDVEGKNKRVFDRK